MDDVHPPEPDERATLTDDEIETRTFSSAPSASLDDDSDTGDTGDDTGDESDTGDDTGDESDTTDVGDDSGDTGDDSGDDSGDSGA